MDPMDSRRITLATKPGASLAVNTYTPDNPTSLPLPLSKTLIVFLNGLAAPQTSWKPTLTILLQHHKPSLPALLTYDRYGQGASDPDPTDPPDTPYGHDADTVISDLHQLLSQACRDTLRLPPPGTNDSATTHLIFICNSIGCPLARLYAAAHPGTVPAFLFLDSMMANSDFVSVFPDPDAADFDPTTLPRDVSVRDLRHAREQYGARFHPTVPNGEGLDRRDLPRRLPFADGPVLPPGPDGRPPLVRVVGHDFERFARDGLEVWGSTSWMRAMSEVLGTDGDRDPWLYRWL